MATKNIEDWKESWHKEDIGFHQPTVNKMLQKHISTLTSEGKQKIFIPLCGKTLDMKWLLDLGHTVVGVDGVEKALQDFYTEHSFQCIEEDVPNLGEESKVLKLENNTLRLYLSDIFLFNKSVEGQFDCVWDRGSLVALNRPDIKKYVAVLKDILKPNGKILVEVFEYDIANYEAGKQPPPPHAMYEDEIRGLYEPDCTVTKIDQGTRLLKEKEAKIVYYLIVKN